jgi:hypothetical protein
MKATEERPPNEGGLLLVRTQMSYASSETQSALPLTAISHEANSEET